MPERENIRELILRLLKRQGYVRTADVMKTSGISRQYANVFLKRLREEGRIALVGKSNQARYLSAAPGTVRKARKSIREIHKMLANRTLSEDHVLNEIKEESGIFNGLPNNVSHILEYAFAEMLNNAIEHSRSKKIDVRMKRTRGEVWFKVVDRGIGIFRNIMEKQNLSSELEAIQDLLKGKQTTVPERHSGEGIFFTSKVADRLTIHGSHKRLIFDNVLGDIFIKDAAPIQGTRVEFSISHDSKRNLQSIFKDYAGEEFEFGKTVVTVDLYEAKGSLVSRSQARRILAGLERFKDVVLDFENVETVGQGFADEVFRVWQSSNPHVRIQARHANENVQFMIEHALRHEH